MKKYRYKFECFDRNPVTGDRQREALISVIADDELDARKVARELLVRGAYNLYEITEEL